MTETQPTTEPRKRPYRDYVDLAFPTLFIPILGYIASKESVSAVGAIGLFTAGVPFFLLGVRALNRLRHPDRVPARWPSEQHPAGRRFEQLSLWLILFTIAVITLGIFFDNKHHHLYHYLWFNAAGWNAILTRYIQDRKAIPPPPEGGWSGTIKGLHSDHWGVR